MHERLNELIGGLVLGAELAAEGAADMADEERRGWEQVHWQAAGWQDICLRGRINEALRVLDESASEADAQFECTFGDSKRTRDRLNPKRVGEGFCARIRLLVKLVLRFEWAAAARLRDELVTDGVQAATIV